MTCAQEEPLIMKSKGQLVRAIKEEHVDVMSKGSQQGGDCHHEEHVDAMVLFDPRMTNEHFFSQTPPPPCPRGD
jgi:hypothetical protein